MRTDGMAHSCMDVAAESVSLVAGDAGSEPGFGDEVVPGRVAELRTAAGKRAFKKEWQSIRHGWLSERLNMGDPQTLTNFVQWGIGTYPAEKYAVVLWNHGEGWRNSLNSLPKRDAICEDETSGDYLGMDEVRQAFATVHATAGPTDLIGMDACLMAMIEVDMQIQPYVRVRVASEETEPGSGYPFDTILADLRDRPDRSASDLGQTIVQKYHEAYKGETQSAVDAVGDPGRKERVLDDPRLRVRAVEHRHVIEPGALARQRLRLVDNPARLVGVGLAFEHTQRLAGVRGSPQVLAQTLAVVGDQRVCRV